MKINWNFLGGGGVQNKKPSVGGVWIFYGTAHCNVGEASASAISPWLVVHAGFPVSINNYIVAYMNLLHCIFGDQRK